MLLVYEVSYSNQEFRNFLTINRGGIIPPQIMGVNLPHPSHFRRPWIQAEWNFFATSYGKSPSEGLGGTIKILTGLTSFKDLKNIIF